MYVLLQSKTRLFYIGLIPVNATGVPSFGSIVVVLVKVSARIGSRERAILSGPHRILLSPPTFYLLRCRADQIEPSLRPIGLIKNNLSNRDVTSSFVEAFVSHEGLI